MKKRSNNTSDSKATRNRHNEGRNKNDDHLENDKSDVVVDDETTNQGFGEWLRSNDGVEMMRLFVIANSLLLFVTMAWPNMKESYYIVRDYFMGEEEEDY